ncbi:MAG: hypothetical protein ACM3RX_02950 [Methanococcaceae archaeon]
MVHHFGTFPELEDQMCEWVPGAEKSPDREEALVWVLSCLDLAPWHFSDNTRNYNEVGYGISENVDGVYGNFSSQGQTCSNYGNAREYLQREDMNF